MLITWWLLAVISPNSPSSFFASTYEPSCIRAQLALAYVFSSSYNQQQRFTADKCIDFTTYTPHCTTPFPSNVAIMPNYRSITISLLSQFDVLTIPEFSPPAVANDPFVASPTLISSDQALVSVYIPIYSSSQFWLNYSISAPHPPKALYYFKLYLNGACVMSWGCGEEDGYKGKTMFGLYDSGAVFFGQRVIEKRILSFSNENGFVPDHTVDDPKDVMEVKVFRAKGRKRIKPAVEVFHNIVAAKNSTMKSPHQLGGGGIRQATSTGIAQAVNYLLCYSLVNAGLVPIKHPQRYYKYALLDPLDQPFATFRYFYRTWGRFRPPPQLLPVHQLTLGPHIDQLEYLGIIPGSHSPSTFPSSHTDSPPERPASPVQNSINTTSSTSTGFSVITDNENAESFGDSHPAIDLTSIAKAAHALLPTCPAPATFPVQSSENRPTEVPRSATPRPTSITTKTHFTDFLRAMSPSKGHKPPSPSPTRVHRSMSIGVLLDVVNNAVRRRGRSEEPREHMRSLSTEPERPSSKGEDGTNNGEVQKSGESEIKMGKRRASEGESGDGENSTARKSDDSEKASKTSTDSGSDVSRERRGRTRKKPESNMSLWEKL